MGKIENAKYIRSFLEKLRHGQIKYNFTQFQILSGILMFIRHDIGMESCNFKAPNEKYKWKKFYMDIEDEHCVIVFNDCNIEINNYRYSVWDTDWMTPTNPMEVIYDPANINSKWVFKGTDDELDKDGKIPTDIYNDIIKVLCYAMYDSIDCPVEVLYEIFSMDSLDLDYKEVQHENDN